MTVRTVTFAECEHSEDLSYYIEDLRRSGARVLDARVDQSAETACVRIEVADWDGFMNRFRETESWEFSSLWQPPSRQRVW